MCSSFLCRFANFESLHLFFFLLFSEEQDVRKKFAFKKMANKEKERDRETEREKKKRIRFR